MNTEALTTATPAQQVRPDILQIVTAEGRLLMRISPGGEVEGAIEDMGEAARIFMRDVRSLAASLASPDTHITGPVKLTTLPEA